MGFYSCAMILMSKNTLGNVNGVISEPDTFSSHQKQPLSISSSRDYFPCLLYQQIIPYYMGKPDMKSTPILSLGKYGHYGLEVHVQFL